MELSGRTVLVVGFARTGQALARFLADRGARVRVTDRKRREDLGPAVEPLAARGVEFETGGHAPASFLGADLIVLSPGVPPLPEAEAARGRGVPVVSELELASRFLRGRIAAVTGSNGKSTTATLAWRILKESGARAFLAGNIGTPLVSFVEKSRPGDVYVTEVSSFQLEYTDTFKPAAAAFLNVSENHLDWHKSFEAYFAAKAKAFRNMDADGAGVLNRDDPRVWPLAAAGPWRAYAFSRRRRPARGCFLRDGEVVLRDGGDERALLRVSDVRLPGLHNLENVMAAALLGHVFGASPAAVRRAVRAFRGLEHRLETVASIRGVLYVNDSKATTVDATKKALASFDRPIVLILGGRGKGGGFDGLRPAVRGKVRHAVLVGEAADKIAAALDGAVPTERAADYRDVVRKAAAAARRGDVILLAPACTSWDMFRDFEERGRVFKREVRRLAAAARRGA